MLTPKQLLAAKTTSNCLKQRMILSIDKQSLLLEFAGTKSCSKWANSNENGWLLGATAGKHEKEERETVCTLHARQTGSAAITV